MAFLSILYFFPPTFKNQLIVRSVRDLHSHCNGCFFFLNSWAAKSFGGGSTFKVQVGVLGEEMRKQRQTSLSIKILLAASLPALFPPQGVGCCWPRPAGCAVALWGCAGSTGAGSVLATVTPARGFLPPPQRKGAVM